jgi:hypothetical protein
LEGDDLYQPRLPEGAIVAAQSILPSDVIALSGRVAAILVESLVRRRTRHSWHARRAFDARDLRHSEHVHDGDDVLVDAYGGSILVDRRAGPHGIRAAGARIPNALGAL